MKCLKKVILKRDTPPQNDYFVIFHLPPCCSKPVKALFVFGTQFRIFWMKTGRQSQRSTILEIIAKCKMRTLLYQPRHRDESSLTIYALI